ncbi:MAG: cation:proton antiporter [Planctomycetes bacterium]|nr:cation:proton antiporter [Planctomycetota bacterium]
MDFISTTNFPAWAEPLVEVRDFLFKDNPVLVLAFLFLAAMTVARLSGKFKYMPKVTAYLLVGLATGPYALGIIDGKFLTSMQGVKDVGLALIVFLVGTELTLKTLGSVNKSANRIAVSEIALTFVLVAVGVGGAATAAVYLDPDLGITGWNAWQIGLIMACVAIATAPAATLAVVREYNADGAVARHIKAAVARNNIFALCLFGLLSPWILGVAEGHDLLHEGILPSLRWVLLPFPIGVAIGFTLAYFETLEEKPAIRMLLGLGALMATVGISKLVGCSEILTVLLAGFGYANSSVKKAPVKDQLRTLEVPFYVIFFILSGAKLNVASVAELGLIGLAFVVLRTVGKVAGPLIGAKWSKLDPQTGKYISMSLLSQSAIALAIMAIVIERQPNSTLATLVTTLILAAVLVFEIAGPVLVKVSVLKSGEVSIVDAVKHKERIASGNQLFAVFAELMRHLGLASYGIKKELGDLVIKNNQGLSVDADFDKITKFIENYPYDSFPIVDKAGLYVGFISYNEIKDAGFDPVMKDLVRAADLITGSVAIDLDEDDIDSAYVKLRDLPNTALPVIKHTEDDKRLLVGTVTQRELLQAYMELHDGEG